MDDIIQAVRLIRIGEDLIQAELTGRADDIGILDADFQEVKGRGVFGGRFSASGRRLGDIQFCRLARRKLPLVGKIVHRQHGAGMLKKVVILIERLQIVGNQRRGPIAAMNHVRLPVQQLQRFQDASAKNSETFRIVRIILVVLWVAVKPFAVEVFRHGKKIDMNFRIGQKGRFAISGLTVFS